MCVLGQPEPVGSVLTFSSGYDTLEYSWGESYSSIRALADFIRDVTKYQQSTKPLINTCDLIIVVLLNTLKFLQVLHGQCSICVFSILAWFSAA